LNFQNNLSDTRQTVICIKKADAIIAVCFFNYPENSIGEVRKTMNRLEGFTINGKIRTFYVSRDQQVSIKLKIFNGGSPYVSFSFCRTVRTVCYVIQPVRR